MGEILNFEQSLRRARGRREAPPEGATILFFLGVRYERWPEPKDKKPAPRGRGKNGRSGRKRERSA